MLSAVAVLAPGHLEYDRDRGPRPGSMFPSLYRLSPTAPLFSIADGQSNDKRTWDIVMSPYKWLQCAMRGWSWRGVRCSPSGENRRKLGAVAETPQARGTKTSRCRSEAGRIGERRGWRNSGGGDDGSGGGGGGGGSGISARTATTERTHAVQRKPRWRARGSRHFCPPTRERNHVVQCVTHESRIEDFKAYKDLRLIKLDDLNFFITTFLNYIIISHVLFRTVKIYGERAEPPTRFRIVRFCGAFLKSVRAGRTQAGQTREIIKRNSIDVQLYRSSDSSFVGAAGHFNAISQAHLITANKPSFRRISFRCLQE
ncbi:hypothetical protein EAG_16431 [Camponotus floridanus]|uniref:Uncharacterized protein n=1 Tax=Camponotus floridanus TaxID=104421 RepID=E2ASQ6_CAMFO|nr:hypothetical protein EAG_16431 [Camponotus floridanus]